MGSSGELRPVLAEPFLVDNSELFSMRFVMGEAEGEVCTLALTSPSVGRAVSSPNVAKMAVIPNC